MLETKEPTLSLGCKDKLDTCPAWKKEGECTKIQSQNFMKKYCAKTCNKCPGKIVLLAF